MNEQLNSKSAVILEDPWSPPPDRGLFAWWRKWLARRREARTLAVWNRQAPVGGGEVLIWDWAGQASNPLPGGSPYYAENAHAKPGGAVPSSMGLSNEELTTLFFAGDSNCFLIPWTIETIVPEIARLKRNKKKHSHLVAELAKMEGARPEISSCQTAQIARLNACPW